MIFFFSPDAVLRGSVVVQEHYYTSPERAYSPACARTHSSSCTNIARAREYVRVLPVDRKTVYLNKHFFRLLEENLCIEEIAITVCLLGLATTLLSFVSAFSDPDPWFLWFCEWSGSWFFVLLSSGHTF